MKRPDGREENLLWLRARMRMKRGIDRNEECVKRIKIGKTRKHTRWKRGEFVVVERVRKHSECGDGGMRELREI